MFFFYTNYTCQLHRVASVHCNCTLNIGIARESTKLCFDKSNKLIEMLKVAFLLLLAGSTRLQVKCQTAMAILSSVKTH